MSINVPEEFITVAAILDVLTQLAVTYAGVTMALPRREMVFPAMVSSAYKIPFLLS